ncbi:DUF5133 domain-containing protein [Streptomyces sp. NPDC058171]
MHPSSPEVLRDLLTRYATLRIAVAEQDGPARRRALEEVSRALCQVTRTDDPRDAVAAADTALARSCCGAHAPSAVRRAA